NVRSLAGSRDAVVQGRDHGQVAVRRGRGAPRADRGGGGGGRLPAERLRLGALPRRARCRAPLARPEDHCSGPMSTGGVGRGGSCGGAGSAGAPTGPSPSPTTPELLAVVTAGPGWTK